MSSILTNTGAMVALQTLRGINSNLSKTQSDISTGKSIASAKDNSATWAIAKVMESDVSGFKGISDSLALGASTIAVAATAANKITDLLTEMKQKIVAAQEQNVDREKLQTDIEALSGQIGSISGAAQFNGLNLLNIDNGLALGSTAKQILEAPDKSKMSILSSLDRSADGTVAAAHIEAKRADLASNDGVFGTGAALASTAFTNGTAGSIGQADQGPPIVPKSVTFVIAGDATGDRVGHPVIEGDSYKVVIGTIESFYVAKKGDTIESVRQGMIKNLSQKLDGHATLSVAAGSAAGSFVVTSRDTSGAVTVSMSAKAGGKAAGGLADLNTLNVTTEKDAQIGRAHV